MDLKWCTKLDVVYRRGALLFSKAIHQISRSHGLKNRWFGSNLSKITRPVAAIKSLRFALFSQVIHQISRSHRTKHHWFWPKFGVSGLLAGHSFQIPQICLVQGHPVIFKVARDRKLLIFTRIECFQTVTLDWIHSWLWNDAQSLYSKEEVSYCFSRSSLNFQGHTAQKIIDFDPNWVFLDCTSSLNSPMGTKWCTKLEEA